MPSTPADRLSGFVSQCIALAPSKPEPSVFLMQNARFVETRLQALAGDRPGPGIEGLTAWDLSDAAEALEAEALRLGRLAAT